MNKKKENVLIVKYFANNIYNLINEHYLLIL
uniref:Uncharacterized protein n=1 Tax=viral metagenome TaxID=1070528 RepID=A0A6C0LX66_9ZZZZ